MNIGRHNFFCLKLDGALGSSPYLFYRGHGGFTEGDTLICMFTSVACNWQTWLERLTFLATLKTWCATFCLQCSTIFYDCTDSVTWIGFSGLRSYGVVFVKGPPMWKSVVKSHVSKCGHTHRIGERQLLFITFLLWLVFILWRNCDNFLNSIYITCSDRWVNGMGSLTLLCACQL